MTSFFRCDLPAHFLQRTGTYWREKIAARIEIETGLVMPSRQWMLTNQFEASPK
jgi:hypothetical protein